MTATYLGTHGSHLMQEFLPEPPPVDRDIQSATKGADVDDFVRDASEVAVWFESQTPDGFDELMAVSLSVKPAELSLAKRASDRNTRACLNSCRARARRPRRAS